MADWTELPDTAVGIGGLPSGTTVTALRDNAIAIAEGAAGAPRVQLGAFASGALANGIAVFGVGTVGTYALLRFAPLITAAPGSTHAGSGLAFTNATGTSLGSVTGTWRLMGGTVLSSAAGSTSVFLRIS